MAEVLDRCPTCGQKKRAKRGQGASAVLEWNRLPKADMDVT